MRRLSSLGSKSLAHRKGRSILTGAGIVLGVAIFFGVLVSNATTQRGVDRLIESFTGRADVVVNATGAFDSTIPEATAKKVMSLDGVRVASGGFGFGAELADPKVEQEDGQGFGPDGLSISGIDLAAERKVQDFELVDGRFFRPGTLEVLVPKRFAERQDLSVGDTVGLKTPKGRKSVKVIGILDDTGAGRTFGGNIMYASIDRVRREAGEGAVFGGIAIILERGIVIGDWIEDHEDTVQGVRFQNAETLAQGFKSFLQVFGVFLMFFSVITLFISAFLIYLTLSMAVIERTRMYGTLRALGATRGQVRRVVIGEALALGAVSTVLGLLLGLALAKGLLGLISGLFQLDIPGLVIQPVALIVAVCIGMLVTLASALLPAIRAGRLAPVEAMRGDYAGEARLGRSWMVGLAVFVVSSGLALTARGAEGEASPIAPLGVLGILLGAILLVPLLLRPLAGVLGRITNRLARGVGEIAVLHLAKERSRSAYTLALIMIVMAMLFASGGLYLSTRAAIDEIVDRQFGADMFIEGNAPIEPEVEAKLRAVDGIESVSPMRFGFTNLESPRSPARPSGDRPVVTNEEEDAFVVIVDPATYFEHSSFFWKDGNDAAAKAALTKGGSILSSAVLADELDVDVGSRVVLGGSDKTFTVAGIYRDAPGPPAIAMSIGDAKRYLNAGKPMGFVANLRADARPAVVKETIEDTLGEEYGLDVQTVTETKEDARGQVTQYFRIVYAILLVAAIVGLLGLANTLAMSVLRRFREIGILRAIGVTRSQMWRMVMIESLTLGFVAFVLSIPLGLLLTGIVVRTIGTGFGFGLETSYPWSWIPIVALFGLIITVVAAIAPGRRASRLHVVSALQYE